MINSNNFAKFNFIINIYREIDSIKFQIILFLLEFYFYIHYRKFSSKRNSKIKYIFARKLFSLIIIYIKI